MRSCIIWMEEIYDMSVLFKQKVRIRHSQRKYMILLERKDGLTKGLMALQARLLINQSQNTVRRHDQNGRQL